MMTDLSLLKMGLKLASRPSVRPSLAMLADNGTLLVPPRCNWLNGATNWPLFGNGRFGCCVLASAARQIMAWLMAADSKRPFPTVDEVLAAYTQTTAREGAAFDPTTGANDNGCYDADACQVWQHIGIGGHRIAGWIPLDFRNPDELRYAIATFGGIRVALNLPQYAKDQYERRIGWTTGKINSPGREPGSWGPHQVWIGAYDQFCYTCVPWDRPQKMTSWFLLNYCVEASAAVSDDFLRSDRRDPCGLNLEELIKTMYSMRHVS